MLSARLNYSGMLARRDELLGTAKSWPWVEARKVLARVRARQDGSARAGDSALCGGQAGQAEATERVVFETGYGPSGLPHIGTFGEVVRTDMVRRAFRMLCQDSIATELVCFSDDMDGMRKVPTNVPRRDLLEQYIDQPLTRVPDPFGTHPSFAAHNNHQLQVFLDNLGIDYRFVSSSEQYEAGKFDDTLRICAAKHDELIAAVLPTLGAERAATYSPFLPLCPRTGRVLMVKTRLVDARRGVIAYTHPDSGTEEQTAVTGGRVKLQWKADWAMRWRALGVDYEMAGKDLIDSVRLSSKLVRIIGGIAPETLSYELFLDAAGEKISKSRGNGLSVEDWLRFGNEESLRLFMYQKPTTAKRLHLGLVPKTVDDYFALVEAFKGYESGAQADDSVPPAALDSPIFHIHGVDAQLPTPPPLSYSLLLNLVAAAGADTAEVLWQFVARYAPHHASLSSPQMQQLVDSALRYYHQFVAHTLDKRQASAGEAAAMDDLARRLRQLLASPAGIGLTRQQLDSSAAAEPIQNIVYQVGKDHGFNPLRDWFRALYEVLIGQSSGPRFGSLVAAVGVERMCVMIETALLPCGDTLQSTE